MRWWLEVKKACQVRQDGRRADVAVQRGSIWEASVIVPSIAASLERASRRACIAGSTAKACMPLSLL